MNDILYSIITPVFNREDCVARCIESVCRNYRNTPIFEHIIVDDGSQDNSVSIIEKYAAKYPHIQFLKFSHNHGVNAARNAAIDKAKGKWCILLDSDDYFVDDALKTISATMKVNPNYKHYMFTPNDMQDYFKVNAVILGASQKILSYKDFLSGNIGGDFIHVCNTAILRKHPFNEGLRIYEGVFFLMFYRDAQKMLFTNKVVTIRERNREDSISKDFLRTSDIVIKRTILYNEIYLQNFKQDLLENGLNNILHKRYLMLLENYVLLGNYKDANVLISKMGVPLNMKDKLLRIIVAFKVGKLYKLAMQMYLYVKYKTLKKKMRV